VLKAYTEGVNAGLHDLRSRPWPYLLLQVQPSDWKIEDSALAGYAMFFDLQDDSNSRELALWKIRQIVPDALYRLIAADGSEWDAPLMGEAHGNVPLPDANTLDLRKLPMPSEEIEHADSEPAAPGSNNFAVDGALTADGRAIVANDMHLGLRVPDIWFRARMQFNDPKAPGGKVDVSGFTLPGVPFVVAGSNGHVAWGFTNSYGDWLDFYQVQWLDAAHTRYQTPAGIATARRFVEKIRVNGGADVSLPVDETIWGPVTETLDAGHSLALDWTAHHPGSLTLGLAALESAGDLDAALAVAPGIGIPGQNLVIGDAHGRIAWRLTARMPKRVPGCDLQAPALPDQDCAWQGWRDGAENPSLIDPPLHRLWTANARTTDGEQLAMIGDAGYANGARAEQIRNDLLAKERFSERDLLAIQLDDRALFLRRWWHLMRPLAMTSQGTDWQQIEAASRNWEGRAAPDAVTYRIVRAWRLAVIDRIKNGLMAPAMAKLGKDFVMPDLPQIEGVAWQLALQQPAHLLPRKFATWQALFDDAAKDVVADLGARGPLTQRRWGERNTAQICHPLAMALPKFASSLLCMPAEPLAGDANMPRVAAPKFGASERMVVAPGHERDGIIEMPGGQSGNPLSPFWGAGHEAWVHGEPTPFLPGKTTHRLTLKP
jgi:penicillin amidase